MDDPRYPQLPLTQGDWSNTLSGIFGTPRQTTDYVPTPPVRPTDLVPTSVPTPPVRQTSSSPYSVMDDLYNGTQAGQYPLNYDPMGSAPGNTGANPYSPYTMPAAPQTPSPDIVSGPMAVAPGNTGANPYALTTLPATSIQNSSVKQPSRPVSVTPLLIKSLLKYA